MYFEKKFILEKKSADDDKSIKNHPACKELVKLQENFTIRYSPNHSAIEHKDKSREKFDLSKKQNKTTTTKLPAKQKHSSRNLI